MPAPTSAAGMKSDGGLVSAVSVVSVTSPKAPLSPAVVSLTSVRAAVAVGLSVVVVVSKVFDAVRVVVGCAVGVVVAVVATRAVGSSA